MRSASMRALIRFHRAAGARVALRANGIVGATVVFLFGVTAPAPDPLATLRDTLLGIVATDHPWTARGFLAAFCIALAGAAAPRVTLGTTGWLRSLGASAAEHRRAAIVALFAAQALALIFVALTALVVMFVYHRSLSAPKLVSVPGLLVASAMLVLPVRRQTMRLLAALALVLFLPGTWALGAIGAVVLVIADRSSGEIVRVRKRRSLVALGMTQSALVTSIRLTWRTLSPSTLLGALALPALFIAFAFLIVRHNPDIPIDMRDRTIRISGSLALAALGIPLSNALVRDRPPWSWSRSLPWSSRQRVVADAVAIGIPLAFVPLVLAPVGARAALSLAVIVPPVAILTASALRVGASRQTGAAGEAATLTLIVGILVVLWPLTCIAIFTLSPLLLRWAAERERGVVTSAWVELQHHAVGDPRWLDAP